ncbi:MAG: ATP-binding cassette domain-containing protein [Prevotellaceae bacterium]|jgi:ABC-type lipoprotein export system ATPase subunit|nr:ATP-binding cassette domain-containing protein [Prevotellaceae bacterium]
MSLIQLSGIVKNYQDGENRLNHVLRGVDISVERGDFVAVKGFSGAGKTTLLQILGTLLLPDAGSYIFDGTEMTAAGTDHSAVRNRKIGFVFQDHRLMPQYCVLENILLPVLAHQSKVKIEQSEYAKKLMEITGISKITKQYPHTISGGEASRAALCRALIMKPLLVLADEPTGQLDSENARNIALLLSGINKTLNTTIVMVTHSDEVSSVAHRVLILEKGVIR